MPPRRRNLRKRVPRPKPWVEAELLLLREHYKGLSSDKLKKILIGRTGKEIEAQAKRMHLRKLEPRAGDVFGKLIVLYRIRAIDRRRDSYRRKAARVRCECGNEKVVHLHELTSGAIISCGCQKFVHGLTNSRIYRIYTGMLTRTTNQNHADFLHYGARNIKVSSDFALFQDFYDWSMANGYADDLSIDRIDVNGDYSRENCRWVSDYVQANNRTCTRYLTAFGETKSVAEWSRDPRTVCTNYQTLYRRTVKQGWDHERAITTKSR